jgi:galactokinase
VQAISIPEGVVVVVCDTMKWRELTSSAYNTRRAECEEAVRVLQGKLPGIRALRDVSPEQFEAHKAVVLINKVDLAVAMGVDPDALVRDVHNLKPSIEAIKVSCTRGDGIDEAVRALGL